MNRPRVCTVVSCGESKQDLDAGETVPARELYSSSVHTCKDRYGRHSDGYYIMSAEYGLVHHRTEIAEYDRTLDNMTDTRVRAWGRDVADDLRDVLAEGDFDAVVLIGSETYVGALVPHFERLPADVLTPWQTSEFVTGVGRGMSWCNDELNWPENVSSVDEIGEVVSEG
ncbi:DUF6884 domain-containing protein [Natrinema ejinorense]|uniref:DUF6884 domain-containing protein n=1 Tax=Natrinema ejinorense TaxID=373386 RepID=A0A2A5QP80_9EURY|nr:DUF6884 domain-containing protein [Natrinema ejinorense]PCR88624.1 hypothetical protein CP557_21555 [Natrinema ejinorense]